MERDAPRLLILGLGTEGRRDDAAGLVVARGLMGRLAGRATVEEGPTDPGALLDRWKGVPAVIVVDAVRSHAPAGTIHRIRVRAGTFPPTVQPTSTHGLSLREAVALGQALGRMPGNLVLYGIEAADVSPGLGLSPPVVSAVEHVMDDLAAAVLAPEPPRPGEATVDRA
jgi:hydrogenase maturation protease